MALPPLNGSPLKKASDLLAATLKAWGLSSLLPHLQDYLTRGYDATTINLYLQDTKEWQARFAGNELRKAAGLGVLSPAQYIATEEQYRNVMQSYGLPAGFYDSHDDFNAFIGKDISPAELANRAKIAHDQYMNAPTATKQLWQQYGFSNGDAVAAILDPKVGTQILQDRADTVAIGGAAGQLGINVSGARAGQFQQHGTTLAEAQKAYAFIAQNMGTDQNIANRFGQKFDQTQEENDLLLGLGPEAKQRQSMYANENSIFAGHAGENAQSLSVAQEH